MSSTPSGEDDIPDKDTCEKRCEKFVEITGTDSACAMFYLQDVHWNLEVNLLFYSREISRALRDVITFKRYMLNVDKLMIKKKNHSCIFKCF